MDDWQEAAFTSRHMHNRNGGRKSRRTAPFDVRRTFGTYFISTNRSGGRGFDVSLVLDVFRLSDSGEAMLGRLRDGDAAEVPVVLAGSRKTLAVEVDRLRQGSGGDVEGEDGAQGDAEQEGGAEDEDEAAGQHSDHHHDSDEDDDPDAAQRRRFQAFEKNSFRNPKFWLRFPSPTTYSPAPLPATSQPPSHDRDREDTHGHDPEDDDRVDERTGYLVFASNSCNKFTGTIRCAAMGWVQDVSVIGRREAALKERDNIVSWV